MQISPKAVKDLKNMPSKDRNAILEKLKGYEESGLGDVKKLTNSDYWRLRHGNWRAIFEMQGELLVLRVLHRKEAYK